MATTTKAKAARTTLVDAQVILDKRGWHKGGLEGVAGGVCLLRALQIANGPGQAEAIRIVERCIGTQIPSWNDNSTTTYDDVKTVLAAAKYIAEDLQEAVTT